jgi:hypothetical protein
MNQNQTVYKLKNGNKGNWELPIKETFINRIVGNSDLGGRKIKYVKGSKSIWADDLPEHLASQKVWFSKGFLFVPNSDKNLLEILEKHSYNGIHYNLFDKKSLALKELSALKAKDEIISLISNSDQEKIIATAMAVFNTQAFDWDLPTCELELRKYAEKNPTKLLSELNSKTYESKYISALAFGKGIVRYKLGKTSIVWNDTTEGEILKLARGENGVEKLGELLSKRTGESEVLLQAISHKLDSKAMSLPKKEDAVESEKDKEIAELRKQLAESQKPKSDNSTNLVLEDLQKKYKEKFDKKVPNVYKNNADWIQEKITE